MSADGVHRTTGFDRNGFTLLELLFVLVIGVIVLGASLQFAVGTFRSNEANRRHEDIVRNSRFIGMSLERDLQETGVGMESLTEFGTLVTYGDTVVILRVPFEPAEAPAYPIDPPAGTANPLPAGGTCGPYCVKVLKPAGTFDLQAGDVARLQVSSERRLIHITALNDYGAGVEVTFDPGETLLSLPAAFADDLRLDRFSTFIQKVGPIIYYRNGDALMRAEALNADGSPAGDAIAYGLRTWDAWIRFVDGDEAEEAEPLDADITNDYDDLLGLRIAARIAPDHPSVRGGQLENEPVRDLEWRFTPRNLTYERNRLQ